jgi:hypothetical protein
MYAALRHVVFVLVLAITLRPLPAGAQRTVRTAAKQLLGGAFSESTIDSVATVLALQIATFPIGSSSGGFTLIPTPDNTGGVDHKKDSFGPLFAERASTLGTEGVFTIGVNAQSTRFVSFEGLGLRNGELTSTIVAGGTIVDLDRYTFDVSTQTMSIFANYAVLDNVDVGVLVPIVKTSLSGTASALNPQSPQRIETVVDVTNTGFGDIAVRGKWNFLNRPTGRPPADPLRDPGDVPIPDRKSYGLAAAVEVFLPTGSEERLSTAGRLRIKPMFVASADFDGFAPHANIGYTFGGSGVEIIDRPPLLPDIVSAEASDEINYVVGAEAWPSRSLTLFADLIGRSLRNVARFEGGRRIVTVPGFGPLAVQGLVARVGTLNLRLGSVGAKLRVLDAGLISLGLLFPLNEGGVKPGLTPVVGFEYTFGPR